MKVQYENKQVEMDDNFSWKSFTGRNQITVPNNINIYHSSFAQEEPDTIVFPANMTGVTFYNCNLDNVVIPAGNTVVGGSQQRTKVQNDLANWTIDSNNNPVRIVNYKTFIKKGIPEPTPADIPKTRLTNYPY